MNKQEVLNEIEEKLNSLDGCIVPYEDITGRFKALQECKLLIEHLDEPQKVKVPAFVAEWFEKNSRKLEEAVYQLNVSIENTDEQYWGDMFRWADNPENKPIETLIRMLDGYEVEKEPVYEIPLIGLVTSVGRQQFLSFDVNNENFFASRKSMYLKQTFTEHELMTVPGNYQKMATLVEKV